jgi:hypothetical protein
LVGSNLKKAASGEKTTVDLRSAKGAKVGSFARDDRGSVTLKMAAGAMSAGQEKKLLDFVAKLLA